MPVRNQDSSQGNANRRRSGQARASVLVLDDDIHFRTSVAYALEREGFVSRQAADLAEMRAVLDEHEVDLILADSRLADGSDGWKEAFDYRAQRPHVKVVCVSGFDREAIAETGGIVPDYSIEKTGSWYNVLHAVERALEG